MLAHFAKDNPRFDRKRFLSACGFAKDNPRFDRKRFLSACGMGPEPTICSCCDKEIKQGDAILFAGSIRLCGPCVRRIKA